MRAASAGTFDLVATPPLPTSLYGKQLEVTSATLCYSASTVAKVENIFVWQATYGGGGVGSAVPLVDNEKTRTGSACARFAVSNPIPLSSLNDIAITVGADFKSSGVLDLGQSGLTLMPTAAAASAPKSGRGGSS